MKRPPGPTRARVVWLDVIPWLIIGGTFALALLSGCRAEEEPPLQPRLATVTESVYASATVRAADAARIHARIGGIVETFIPREGDRVVAGQVIGHIAPLGHGEAVRAARVALANARRRASAGSAARREVELAVASAAGRAREDAAQAARLGRLWEQAIGTRRDLEAAELRADLSRRELARQRERGRELDGELRHAARLAEVNLERERAHAAGLTVRSRGAGVVYEVSVEPGDYVAPNQPLATVASADSFFLELLVDEADVVRVATGAIAYVTLEAYPDSVFEARLTRVLPGKSEASQSFVAEASFARPPARLYPGFVGEANIVVEPGRAGLVLPEGAPELDAGTLSVGGEPHDFHVIRDASLAVDPGEFVSIMGKSGSGKSTLLYILSTMDTDYTGELYLGGELATGRPADQLARLRSGFIGFVFQFHYLLAEFSVLENVMLPARKLAAKPLDEIEHDAMEQLRTLGIDHLATKRAHRVSGGEKQRVAIARALINGPRVLMGDEPTGNLDSRNADVVFETFERLRRERGLSLLIVTHDQDFADRTDRTIVLEDGRVVAGAFPPRSSRPTPAP